MVVGQVIILTPTFTLSTVGRWKSRSQGNWNSKRKEHKLKILRYFVWHSNDSYQQRDTRLQGVVNRFDPSKLLVTWSLFTRVSMKCKVKSSPTVFELRMLREWSYCKPFSYNTLIFLPINTQISLYNRSGRWYCRLNQSK